MVASVLSFLLKEVHTLSPALVYTLTAILVFAEAALFVGFVLPGETAVLVAGVAASQGRVNVAAVAVVVVVFAVAGDSVGYEVGHRWGHVLLRLPILRRRQITVARALDGLRRRGALYVVVGRFTAFLRAVMPGLAGMSDMPYLRFLVANASGGVVWGVGYTLVGYYIGGALTTFERYDTWASWIVLALALGAAVAVHVVSRRLERRGDATFAAAHPDGDLPE